MRLWLCQQEHGIPLSLSFSIWKMGITTAIFFLPMDLQGVVRGLWHHQRQRELSRAHPHPHPGFLLLRGHRLHHSLSQSELGSQPTRALK